MEPRRALAAIAWGRIGIGVTMLLLPGVAARVWVGRPGRLPQTKTVARALGGRDIAIGAGTVMAAQRNQPLDYWTAAGAIADAADALATLASYRHLPSKTRFLILVTAAATAGAEVVLGSALQREAGV